MPQEPNKPQDLNLPENMQPLKPEGQSTDYNKADSTRDAQSQINRVNESGDAVTPRLAQPQRQQEPGASGMGGSIGNQAKSKAMKWAIGAIGGTGGLAGGVTLWNLF